MFMDYLYESATEELQKELGDPNYMVVFNSNTQKYEVQKYLTDEKIWSCSATFGRWTPLERDAYKLFYHESHGGLDFKEYRVKRQKERALQKKHEEDAWSEYGRELGHDFYHASGKRVF
jgi:hypothetical protein